MPHVAGDGDRAALQRYPGPGRRVAVDHDETSPRRCAGAFGGVAADPHRPGHEVLADRPADEALDVDVRAVAQARNIVPDVPGDGDIAAVGQADGEVVPPARLGDAHGAAVGQPAQRRVQLADRELRAAELDRRHTYHI